MALHGKFAINITGSGEFTSDTERSIEDLEGVLDDAVRLFNQRFPELKAEVISS